MSLSRHAPGSRSLAQGLLLLALCLPFLWPLDPGPGAKTASMLLAAGLWSATLLAAAFAGRTPRGGVAAALFVLPALVVGAQTVGGMLAYPSQGWDTVALLLGAALVAGLGRRVAAERDWLIVAGNALLLQGLLQVAIGLIQFALWQLPALSGGISAHAPWFYQFVSFPGDGRIYGNLRQPNHYATALALGCAGLAAVAPRMRRSHVWAAALGLSWALEVSGSRTALAHTLLIAALVLLLVPRAWRAPRLRPLLALPLLYAAWWLLLRECAALGWIHYLDAITRQLDQPVNARALIWHDALQVWRQRPWLGWGWGQIGWGFEQSAVTQHLHPLPLDNIDNAHDLVLQLLATCGVAGTAPVLLLGAALAWRLLRAPWRGGERDAQRGAALLPALAAAGCIALHSLLEYPLWYVYFLFTFAFMLGWGEGVASTAGAAQPTRGAVRGAALAAAALALGLSAKATLDYVRAADVYATTGAAADRARALSRANWFFVPLAEFADAAEVLPDPEDDHAELLDELAQLERASHIWGDPGLLSRRIIVLLRLHRDAQAMALARYTASAFWLYAQRTAADFGPLAAEAGLAGDARVRQAEQILRTAPVLRRVVVPR
jgi:O-antigen ligase